MYKNMQAKYIIFLGIPEFVIRSTIKHNNIIAENPKMQAYTNLSPRFAESNISGFYNRINNLHQNL